MVVKKKKFTMVLFDVDGSSSLLFDRLHHIISGVLPRKLCYWGSIYIRKSAFVCVWRGYIYMYMSAFVCVCGCVCVCVCVCILGIYIKIYAYIKKKNKFHPLLPNWKISYQ